MENTKENMHINILGLKGLSGKSKLEVKCLSTFFSTTRLYNCCLCLSVAIISMVECYKGN